MKRHSPGPGGPQTGLMDCSLTPLDRMSSVTTAQGGPDRVSAPWFAVSRTPSLVVR